MNGFKHTPGPWEYDSQPHHIRIESENTIICYIIGDSVSSRLNSQNIIDANATLIAAAPEMLDALIAQYRYNQWKCTHCMEDEINCKKLKCVINNAKNIIQRATGMTIDDAIKAYNEKMEAMK
jgi:hypothetical protein